MSIDALVDELRAIRVVNDTGALIASKLELEALVQSVVDIAVELTGADFGAFFLQRRRRRRGSDKPLRAIRGRAQRV